jgi:hypothetical protein
MENSLEQENMVIEYELRVLLCTLISTILHLCQKMEYKYFLGFFSRSLSFDTRRWVCNIATIVFATLLEWHMRKGAQGVQHRP